MKCHKKLILLCALATSAAALGQDTYTIKPGDTLTKIARQHGCTVQELVKQNSLKPDSVIHPGQKLNIPGARRAAQVAQADTTGTYTIQPGDTLSSIARRHDMSLHDLIAVNPSINPQALRPGQKIKLSSSRKTATGHGGATTEESTTADQEKPQPLPPRKPTIVTIPVDAEMTFREFAAKHGTDMTRLNQLNGLDLDASTVLAVGSELYVPQDVPAADDRP